LQGIEAADRPTTNAAEMVVEGYFQNGSFLASNNQLEKSCKKNGSAS